MARKGFALKVRSSTLTCLIPFETISFNRSPNSSTGMSVTGLLTIPLTQNLHELKQPLEVSNCTKDLSQENSGESVGGTSEMNSFVETGRERCISSISMNSKPGISLHFSSELSNEEMNGSKISSPSPLNTAVMKLLFLRKLLS